MTMLNQAHVEAICSATYLENYLDCLDTLPDDLQRILTQMREVDVRLTELEKDTTPFEDIFSNVKPDEPLDSKFVPQLQRMLIRMQELQDEKINLTYSLMELIENRTKQLEADRENLDPANHMVNDAPPATPKNQTTVTRKNGNATGGETKAASAAQSSTSSHSMESSKEASKQNDHRVSINSAKKRKQKPETPVSSSKSVSIASKSNHSAMHSHNNGSIAGNSGNNKDEGSSAKKDAAAAHDESKSATKLPNKRKRRSRAKPKEPAKEASPDPGEEPTYCLCHQISYGEMIGCDNDACPIEWFHFNCVHLTNKPKGKWYCPKCRGDKPTVMRKGADKSR